MSENKENTEAQLGGARRKNGHKIHCDCHICENMKNKAKRGGYQEDAEKRELQRMGGSKKKNGHKPNCVCPICKNMKNAKKGGDMDDKKIISDLQEAGRKKKGNGHKATCGCPICKNMKKNKKGGDDDDIEKGMSGDIDEGLVAKDKLDVSPKTPIPASDDEYDILDATEKGQVAPESVGGTRKRRGSRRSNGHKPNCGCPICRNMSKGRKTRRHKKGSRRHRR